MSVIDDLKQQSRDADILLASLKELQKTSYTVDNEQLKSVTTQLAVLTKEEKS